MRTNDRGLRLIKKYEGSISLVRLPRSHSTSAAARSMQARCVAKLIDQKLKVQPVSLSDGATLAAGCCQD